MNRPKWQISRNLLSSNDPFSNLTNFAKFVFYPQSPCNKFREICYLPMTVRDKIREICHFVLQISRNLLKFVKLASAISPDPRSRWRSLSARNVRIFISNHLIVLVDHDSSNWLSYELEKNRHIVTCDKFREICKISWQISRTLSKSDASIR